MMRAGGRTSPVDSLLDGLEYLVAEALRTCRADLAEELVRALHAIAEIEERGPVETPPPLRLVSSPPTLRLVPANTRETLQPEPPRDPLSSLSNVIRIHGSRNPAQGLYLCLNQLRQEAVAFRLPFLAHLIDVASEAARLEADEAIGP